MPSVRFDVKGARNLEHAATPQIVLCVEARTAEPERIESTLARVQIRIDAARRSYSDSEKERVREVFGADDVWSRSSKSLLWTHETVVIPAFESQTTFDVHLPCSYDFATAATRYLHGLEAGVVPITLVFSGTVFHRTPAGLAAAPLPWDQGASFALPLDLVRSVIDEHFPASAVVSLDRDVFDRLNRYRRDQGLATWTDAVGRLLAFVSSGGRS